MKKTILALCAVAFVLFINADSCKSHTSDIAATSWSIGSTSFKATSVSRSGGNMITAEDNSNNAMQIFFSALPTTTATYSIVDQSHAQNNTLTATQLVVEYSVGANDVYLSNGSGGATVLVTVNSAGEINMTLPTISVNHVNNGQILGTTTATGTVNVH